MITPPLCLTEVEWREVGEPKESTWLRDQTQPHEGEIRWCHVHLESYEMLNIGYKRWVLYRTINALLNGIDSPEELDAIAIVEVEVLDVDYGTPRYQHGYAQWWRVRCGQVIPLADIPKRLPLMRPLQGDDIRPRGKEDCASKSLSLYSWGTQVNETKIYVKDEVTGARQTLIFYEVSIDNKCEIYNWPVK